MKRHYIIILVIFILVFPACEKQKDIVIENQDIPLISKMIFSNDLYFEYTYNSANLLKEIKTKWSYTIYNYNDENLLTGYDMYEDPGIYSNNWATADSALHRTDWVTPQNTKISGRAVYTYDNEKLKKISVTSFLSGYISYTTYDYDNNGRIGKETFYYNNVADAFNEFVYDDKGNLILVTNKTMVNGIPTITITKDYEFDDNPNPFKAFKRLLRPGEYSNENNIVKETISFFFYVPGVDKIQVTESNYEYNSDGYPARKNNMISYEYR